MDAGKGSRNAAATIRPMPAHHDAVTAASASEQLLVARVAAELAGDVPVVDAGALLADGTDGEALVMALREQVQEGAVVVCAGVVERVASFARVVHGLVALASERQATIILALPNDAAADAPAGGRRSVWTEGAVAELRGLLPSDHVCLHLLALRGTALVPAGDVAEVVVGVHADARATAPAGFVLGFGPRAQDLRAGAMAAPADVSVERARERARTAELEVLRARVAALDARPQLTPANGGQRPESAV
jgi:hypothetical protein